jgi:hypothetical protein
MDRAYFLTYNDMAKIIYSKQTKAIIEQICRYKISTAPVMPATKWKAVLSDVLNAPLGIDVMFKNDQPRLLIVRRTKEFWNPVKINNDVVYLTNGNEIISENQFILRFWTGSKDSRNRVVSMT